MLALGGLTLNGVDATFQACIEFVRELRFFSSSVDTTFFPSILPVFGGHPCPRLQVRGPAYDVGILGIPEVVDVDLLDYDDAGASFITDERVCAA